jgi:recombinational DNA repair ATPase RecF
MDDALLTEILDRLDRAEGLDDHAQLLVLGACQGDGELDLVLHDHDLLRPELPPAGSAPEPVGAYLRRLTVEGFRGIGPAQTIALTPGPGLTLIMGRNGSGKSSFAEAVELLLTGDSLRWRNRSSVWREGWRNLHHPTARVVLELVEEGVAGSTTVTGAWAAGAEVDDVTTTVQRYGAPMQDLGALGWATPLVTYRPFLSYNELGSLLDDGPSKLYDALEAILGLDELNQAHDRLRQSRRTIEKASKAARDELAGLRPQLEDSDDPRATAVLAAVSGRTWHLDRVEQVLVDDDGGADDERTVLRGLASLAAPALDRGEAVAGGLRSAAAELQAVAGTDAAAADRLASLLEQALAVHAHEGDGDCPVCGRTDALDATWHAHAEAEAARLRAVAHAVTAARDGLQRAQRRAEELIDVPPEVLQRALHLGIDTGDVPAAARAWQHWWDGGQSATDPTALAEHIEASLPALHDAVEQARAAAAAELDRLRDAWRPIARDLGAWLSRAVEAEVAAEQLPGLKQAETWLRDAIDAIRGERFAPIADACATHWAALRQRSNVELGRVVLGGTATRRRVTLDVTVDGVAGAALGVMSQGELHALALSLFLPRATVTASPFRFLVIDDPVQSMDPARVEGLARVLAEVAAERQVVVFTHDERLAEAVRRLELPARVLEVTRRAGSAVEVREVDEPVARLLSDAWALAQTEDLPAGVANRVVPGFCRAALEAACVEAVRRRRLGRGDAHLEVEAALAVATTLTQKAALALFDDSARGGDVLGRCNALMRGGADVFQQCQKGTHEGHAGSLQDLVNGSRELARGLRRQ